MGSTRSWWLAAIDDRIRAVVGVACFTRYEDIIATRNLSAHGIYYFVPGMLAHFDTEAVYSLVAPRPMLQLSGDQDAGAPEFTALRETGAQHPIEATGKELRGLMSWIKDSDSDYVEGSAAR